MTGDRSLLDPAPPRLDFAFHIAAEVGPPLSGGGGLAGERLHIPILGGTVAGPRLQGRVLPGGSDWPLIRPDGAAAIMARYTIQAADGTPIMVRNAGLRIADPADVQRMRAGEPVPPATYYFRSTPCFDVPDGPHAWMRDRIFLASLAPSGREVHIDVYTVE
ncbi:MAG: DUF3237 family protein [Sneathiellaceae bacterium]